VSDLVGEGRVAQRRVDRFCAVLSRHDSCVDYDGHGLTESQRSCFVG